MEIKNEYVICSSVNPKTGRRLLVEVTKLLLLDTFFYDKWHSNTDQVDLTHGWVTVIGKKLYRVEKIPSDMVQASVSVAIYQVLVDWNDLETKPQEIQ
jgi:hypothetical protein